MTYKEHQLASGKQYLEELLHRHHGSVNQAAKEAGKSRQHMYKLLERYGVKLKAKKAKPHRYGNAVWHILSVAG